MVATPYTKLKELEQLSSASLDHETAYQIVFDDNLRPLRIISLPDDPEFIYRRGGLDLTRHQAADLIRRNQSRIDYNGK